MVCCFFFTDWQANIFNASSKNHTRKAMIRVKYTISKTEVALWVGAKILKSQSRGLESCNFFLLVQQP